MSEISKNKYKDGVFVPIKLSTGNDTKTVNFKIDTGAQVNVIPVKSYRKLGLPTSALKPTSAHLKSYGGIFYCPGEGHTAKSLQGES